MASPKIVIIYTSKEQKTDLPTFGAFILDRLTSALANPVSPKWVYITRVSEEARVLYTYLYRQQLYIYPGRSPVLIGTISRIRP